VTISITKDNKEIEKSELLEIKEDIFELKTDLREFRKEINIKFDIAIRLLEEKAQVRKRFHDFLQKQHHRS